MSKKTIGKLLAVVVHEEKARIEFILGDGTGITLPVERDEAADLVRYVGRDVEVSVYPVPTPEEKAASDRAMEEYRARVKVAS